MSRELAEHVRTDTGEAFMTFRYFASCNSRCLSQLLCAILLLCPVTATAASQPTPGWHEAVLTHDGIERHYRYYIAKTLANNPPLVILLHGGTQGMTKIFRRHAGATKEWPLLAEEAGFLLVVPNGTSQRNGSGSGNRQNWNDCRATIAGNGAGATADDVGFIRALVSELESNFAIDRNAVYATGASNGGMMSYRLATELGDVIAGVAVFIANRPADNECPPAVTPVPIMIVNGSEDPMMPWAGGEIMGGGGAVLSTAATLDYWLAVNRADRQAAQPEPLPDHNPRDGSHVVRTRYPAGHGGAEVLFYAVQGGGHNMPHAEHVVPRILRKTLIGKQNRDFDSVRAAWQFLSRQRLRRPPAP
jgi:polyhydroxybutyrate depolymerase